MPPCASRSMGSEEAPRQECLGHTILGRNCGFCARSRAAGGEAFAEAEEGALDGKIEQGGGTHAGNEGNSDGGPTAGLYVPAEVDAAEVGDLFVGEVEGVGERGHLGEALCG